MTCKTTFLWLFSTVGSHQLQDKRLKQNAKCKTQSKLLPTRNGAQMKVKPTAELRYKL